MQQEKDNFIFAGLLPDISISKRLALYLIDALNIRISPTNGKNLLSVTNEIGPKALELRNESGGSSLIKGTYLGHCILNTFLVLFTTDGYRDYIIRINISDPEDITFKYLYGTSNNPNSLNLGFNLNYPIEAIPLFENNNIQKIYWTDGLNQPRMINIAPSNDSNIDTYVNTSFDFVPTLNLNESITVETKYTGGIFPAGVILYAFTYYNKFGQESNIFYVSRLHAISYRNRGAKADDTSVPCSFLIKVTGIDTKFEYLRIYSILRTSLNDTPICKKVIDIEINNNYSISYIDTGNVGESISPTELLYKNRDIITTKTLCTKSDTLFLGGILYKRNSIYNIKVTRSGQLKNLVKELQQLFRSSESSGFSLVDKLPEESSNREPFKLYYTKSEEYGIKITDSEIHYENRIELSHLKRHEIYRIGILFLYTTGKWSDPVWLNDFKMSFENATYAVDTSSEMGNIIYDYQLVMILPSENLDNYDLLTALINNGYSRCRLLMAEPSISDRTIYAQGIVNPIVYLISKRHFGNLDNKAYGSYSSCNGSLYGQASWLFRPKLNSCMDDMSSDSTSENYGGYILSTTDDVIDKGMKTEDELHSYNSYLWSNNISIPDLRGMLPLLQKISTDNYNVIYSPKFRSIELGLDLRNNDRFFIDPQCATFHTPELIFDDSLYLLPWSLYYYYLVGACKFECNYGDIDILTASSGISTNGGFLRLTLKTKGNAGLLSGAFYDDAFVRDYRDIDNAEDKTVYYKEWHNDTNNIIQFPVYLWHKDGSLNNDFNRAGLTALLKKKIVSNYKLGTTINKYYLLRSAPLQKEVVDIQPFTSSETSIISLKVKDEGSQFYMGNIDTSLYGKTSVKWFLGLFKYSFNSNNFWDQYESNTLVKYRTYISPSENLYSYYLSPRFSITGADCFPLWKIDEEEASETGFNRALYFNFGDLLNNNKFAVKAFGYLNGVEKHAPIGVTENITNHKTKMYGIRLLSREAFLWDNDWKYKGITTFTNGIWALRMLTTEDALDDNTFNIGKYNHGTCITLEQVRMKYKTTPHLVISFDRKIIGEGTRTVGDRGYIPVLNPSCIYENTNTSELPLVEIKRYNSDSLYANLNLYGGTSELVLKTNKWIPLGEPINFKNGSRILSSNRGDTWLSLFECLKTYSYTTEDTNQLIDIAAFNCESHINLDGRYDRNKGLSSHLHVSPTNFNLLNKVYSLLDNFFTYTILDDSYYKLSTFPNLIIWSLLKSSGEFIDTWSNISTSSAYDIDGSKGEIFKLETWMDNIYCFLNKGISNILFNSRVLIPTSDNIPIEITNNYKVDGYRYVVDGVGCINKNSIKSTPTALYFIDSNSNNLYTINGGGTLDLSTVKNISSWFKQQTNKLWLPNNYSLQTFYDSLNKDVYLVTNSECLYYSEKLGEFVSYLSYGNYTLICNINKVLYGIYKTTNTFVLCSMNKGVPTSDYRIAFTCNGRENSNKSIFDKVFTNIDFRADVWDYKEINGVKCLKSVSSASTAPVPESDPIPAFNTLRVWNEYLDTGTIKVIDNLDKVKNIKEKFRVWRVNIPRAVKYFSNYGTTATYKGKRDRIRNMWCNIELSNVNYSSYNVHNFIELHDVEVTYYI